MCTHAQIICVHVRTHAHTWVRTHMYTQIHKHTHSHTHTHTHRANLGVWGLVGGLEFGSRV